MGALDKYKNVADCKWENPNCSIIENLQAVRDKFEKMTGMVPKQFICSSTTLIEAYRRGIISPKDDTLKIMITDGRKGQKRIEDFLSTWDGKIDEVDWEGIVDL